MVCRSQGVGVVPARPKFNTKSEATEGAKQAYLRWLNRDTDEACAVTKPDITVGQCFKNFLAYSLERAENPDEKFGLGSQQNHIDNVGTSQFHPLHGQVRQARFNHSGKAADLYISGHRHTWGLMSTEMQGRVVWMCRAKGFKDHGEYKVVKGFEAQKLGHTITAIFDPSADTETGFLSCFAEPQEAAEFLTYKRGR